MEDFCIDCEERCDNYCYAFGAVLTKCWCKEPDAFQISFDNYPYKEEF